MTLRKRGVLDIGDIKKIIDRYVERKYMERLYGGEYG
jgi:hypothetical protein